MTWCFKSHALHFYDCVLCFCWSSRSRKGLFEPHLFPVQSTLSYSFDVYHFVKFIPHAVRFQISWEMVKFSIYTKMDCITQLNIKTERHGVWEINRRYHTSWLLYETWEYNSLLVSIYPSLRNVFCIIGHAHNKKGQIFAWLYKMFFLSKFCTLPNKQLECRLIYSP